MTYPTDYLNKIITGDCLEVLKTMPDSCVDSIVTDPPAGIGFMGRKWDSYFTDLPDPAFLNWFAGFIDGEGCFSIHKKKVNNVETYDCQFSISLRADDRPILEEIHRTLGIGTLSNKTAHNDGKDNPKARYSISSKSDCLRLAEILRVAPLRAKKALDFEIWLQGLNEWIEHKPKEWESLKEARERLMASRNYTEYGKVAGSPERRAFIAEMTSIFKQGLRVLKPGGHALVWALPRTSHWTGTALENAGFEVRDCVYHLFGSGFPKSLDISKAIDKQAGKFIEGEETENSRKGVVGDDGNFNHSKRVTANNPQTPEAKQWEGWGTALKPAVECWWLCRKPLGEKTVAENVLKYGTGGLNIDGSRVEYQGQDDWNNTFRPSQNVDKNNWLKEGNKLARRDVIKSSGRFPANLVHDGSDVILAEFPNVKGELHNKQATGDSIFLGERAESKRGFSLNDEGSAARFFYTAKPSASEKNLLFDSTLTVKYNSVICKPEENIVAVQLLKKVISDSALLNLSIDESGENITVQCQLDSLSTIKIIISKITESKILNLLMSLLTNESIVDANLEKVSGGNLAENAGSLKKWILTITKDNRELALGANNVAKTMLNLMSKDGEWKELRNSHPTPKAQSLMSYLIKLITPPKGIVLDMFAGSGSTLLAAKNLGHPYIGIEIDPEYVKIAEGRLKQGVLGF